MPEQAQAIVVRGTDWSETSRITTLFTREFGKIRALAKGGRRLKSNFEIAFDLLTVCKVVYLRKAHGGLDLLIEAQVQERYPALRTNMTALNSGYYLAELLSDGTQDYDPHPRLFDAALSTLRALPSQAEPPMLPAEFKVKSPVSAFELVWLEELGYGPRLEECVACGLVLPVPSLSAVRVSFSPEAGGVVCPGCQQNVRDKRPLSEPGRGAMIALQSCASGLREPHPELTPQLRAEVRAVLGHTVSTVLGRRPRLLADVERG
jgi:DNA repair protein RecO (recombination protein O)